MSFCNDDIVSKGAIRDFEHHVKLRTICERDGLQVTLSLSTSEMKFKPPLHSDRICYKSALMHPCTHAFIHTKIFLHNICIKNKVIKHKRLLHAFAFIQKTLSHPHLLTSTASFPTLIPDSKYLKRIMENMQKQIDALRGDVDQVTDKLDRVLEILASLSLPSRVDPATVGANPPIGSPLSKLVWPSFGSSSGYTSVGAQVPKESMGTNTEFLVGQPRTHQVQPSFAMPQSLGDHKSARQDDNFKGKFVVSSSEETRQRLKAIEDKLRMMESFLANNVSPPHSRSTVSARTPCFNHQYPMVVRPQQSQGFPKQAMQMPLNHSQSRQFAQNLGQPQNQPTTTREKKVVEPIPMSCCRLLSYLVHNGMVTPRALKPMIAPFPAWYDPKAKCEFHLGAEGHTIDKCKAFKYKVQELIDQKLLTFKEGEPNCEG